MVQGFAGFELQGNTTVWGVEAGTTWRCPRAELTLGGGYGKALGRSNTNDDSGFLRLLLLVRW
jgi:hypothetical protein